MARDAFFPLLVAALGLIFCAGGYVTRYRRYTGLIAGFDARLVTDVTGLTRWVGTAGLAIGAVCFLAAAVYYRFPDYHRLIAGGLALALVAGVAASARGCSRFVRRDRNDPDLRNGHHAPGVRAGATHEENRR